MVSPFGGCIEPIVVVAKPVLVSVSTVTPSARPVEPVTFAHESAEADVPPAGQAIGGGVTADVPPPPPPQATRKMARTPTANADTDLDPRVREDDNALNAFEMNFFIAILL